MKQVGIVLSLLCVVMIECGCAPMNTQFSCNETAGDRCLSIEEVNAMTETHDETLSIARKIPEKNPRSERLTQQTTQTIWMAPWKDEKGVLHENDTLIASISPEQKTS